MEILKAYSLSPGDLEQDNIDRILESLKRRPTYRFIEEAMRSDRYPYTIMLIAGQVGMYIPPRKRLGINAYRFFMENVRYYETVFTRRDNVVPSLHEIYISRNRVELLSRFRDDEILRPGYRFTRSYSDRMEMINSFIRDNIDVFGSFHLNTNAPQMFNNDVKPIRYIDPQGNRSDHTIMEIFSNIAGYSRESLHCLRQRIMEKLGQWRERTDPDLDMGTNRLYRLCCDLDGLLDGDVKDNMVSYIDQ